MLSLSNEVKAERKNEKYFRVLSVAVLMTNFIFQVCSIVVTLHREEENNFAVCQH